VTTKKKKNTHSVHTGGKKGNSPKGVNWDSKVLKDLGIKITSVVPAGGKASHKSIIATPQTVAKPQVTNLSISPTNNIQFDFTKKVADGNYSLNWVFYDPDKTAQVGYQVSLFTDQEFSNPNWTPDQTPTIKKTFIGNTDANTYSLDPNDGYINGAQYWACVKVWAKKSGKNWYSDWATIGFTTTIVQPQPPLVAVYTDGTNARNAIAVQTSDNLFSADNGSFKKTSGGWTTTQNGVDTAATSVGIQVTSISISDPLSHKNTISSLSVGAQGGLAEDINASATSFKVTGSTSGTAASHVAFTGKVTNGSTSITGVSSVTGLIIGMAIFGVGIPAGATITNVSGGTTVTISAKATSTHNSANLVGNYYSAADAVGFPRSGQFWIQIGQERILVTNKVNGNNTGDTFYVIKRGYQGTTAASHSAGATVYYGLQKDIYTGYSGQIAMMYTYSQAEKTTSHTYYTTVRETSGVAATTIPLNYGVAFIASSNGKLSANDGKTIYVNDPTGIIQKGSQIQISYYTETAAYTAVNNKLKSTTPAENQFVFPSPSTYFTVENVAGVSVPATTVVIGYVNNWSSASLTQNGGYLRSSSNPLTLLGFVQANNLSLNTLAALNRLPSGTTLYVEANGGYSIPGQTNWNRSGSYSCTFTLAQTGLGNSCAGMPALSIKPANSAGTFNLKNAPGFFYIPNTATISVKIPAQTLPSVQPLTVTLNESLNSIKGLNLAVGQTVRVSNVHYVPAISPTYATVASSTAYTKHSALKTVDDFQDFLVDYNTSAKPVGFKAAVLGFGTTTFTPLTVDGATNGGIFNAVAVPTSSLGGVTAGYTVLMNGLPLGTTVTSTVAITSGTYNGYTAIFFGSSTQGAQPNNTTTTYFINDGVIFYPPAATLISATYSGTGTVPTPVQSIPVVPFTPKYDYLRHTSVKLYNNPLNGDASLSLSCSNTAAVGDSLSDVTIFTPPPYTNQNSIPVNAGVTYGFSAIGKALACGNTTAWFSLLIDWYDELGNLISTHDGSLSIINSGASNTQTWTATKTSGSATLTGVSATQNLVVGAKISGTGIPSYTYITAFSYTAQTVTMSRKATSSGSITVTQTLANLAVPIGVENTTNAGWSPNAIAAIAPTIVFTTNATYLANDTLTGTLAWTGGTPAPALSVGTYLSVNNAVAILTSQSPYNANVLSLKFPFGGAPASGTTGVTVQISASRAAPRINVSNLTYRDTITFCGLQFKALTPYLPTSSYKALNTQMPALSASAYVSTTTAVNADSSFSIPSTTPTAGANSIYLFDPTADNGSREIHFGAGETGRVTYLQKPAKAGDTSITVHNPVGFGAGTTLYIGNSTDATYETAIITAGWDGSPQISLTDPIGFNQAANTPITAQTTRIAGHFINNQPKGTLVAVFNWNNDGYVNTPNTSYRYKIERSDDGTTYNTAFGGDVVVADGRGVGSVNGTGIFYDVEVVPNVATGYRITPSFSDEHNNLVKGVSANVVAPQLTINSWWIASSSDPDRRFPILVQNAFQETQKHPVGVFYPLGSSRPIIVPGVVQGRDAQITVKWTDNANWENFVSLLNLGETLVLTNPVEGTKKYIQISDDVTVTHNAAASPYRDVAITYVEAPPPNGYGYTYGS